MLRIFSCAFLLSACSGQGGVPAFAVPHGSLSTSPDAVEGYAVWEFFSKRWRRKRADKHHVCAEVHEVAGTAVELDSSCAGCSFMYSLDVLALESDCTTDRSDYGIPAGFAFGDVPRSLASDDPQPGVSYGWYVSWEGEDWEPMGFAVPENDNVSDWGDDSRWELNSAWVWDLR